MKKLNKKEQSAILPRAKTEGLMIKELGNEVLVYDTKKHIAYCLNENAARVWQQCDGTKTISELSATFPLQSSEEQAAKKREALTWSAIDQFHKSGLLESAPSYGYANDHLTRRSIIRALGIAAVTLPLVSVITAPTARASASCEDLPSGSTCTISAQCCSGICDSGICF